MAPPMRIPAPKAASASVIFLHGLGDTGLGWKFFADECNRRPSLQHVNFVLPTADRRAYPALGGVTTGWFDIKGLGTALDDVVDDYSGMQASMSIVSKLIQAEIQKGISPDRILVGGFSMGGAVSQSFAASQGEHKLAGFMSLSGFMPHKSQLEASKASTNLDTPIFMGHGTDDDVVPPGEAQKSLAVFKKLGFTNVQFHSYPYLSHSVDPQELNHMLEFLETVLPSK